MINKPPPLAASLILVLILAVAALGWGVVRKAQLDSSSSELALALTEAILSSESMELLLANIHPSFTQNTPIESFQSSISMTSARLGAWTSFDTISGTASIPLLPLFANTATASYEIGVSYESAPASALIEMVYAQGSWQITSFNLVSEFLAP
jgi:hypothetical protein